MIFFRARSALIIGGDFNCIDSTIDKFNCLSVLTIDKKSLCFLLTDFSLVDIRPKQNPRKILFTWSNSDRSQMSRMDRFFSLQNHCFLILSLAIFYLASCPV